jgi:hypothetical protein
MATPVLNVATTIVCPHGGAVTAMAVSPRVLVGGAPVLTVGAAMVQNCPLPDQPCASAIWTAGSPRVFAGGHPVLIQASTGACLTAAGQATGAPRVTTAQTRVTAR